MSRTHKTKPLGVKICQGHVGFYEDHDHRKGPCDLPKLTPTTAEYNRKTRCTYEPDWVNPKSWCGCWLCSAHLERVTNTRRVRHSSKQQLKKWVRDLDSYDEEVISNPKETW